MTTLSDLIARLEAAKEGSRELDAEIAVAVFETQKTGDDLIYAKECARNDNCAAGTYWHVQRSGMSLRTASSYTTSLDAALTLVPEGMEWHVSNRGQIGASRQCFAGVYGTPFVGSECDTNATTPALAICIAALKAREARR